MENQVKILIAEDHTILREGLKALLPASTDLAGIGEADDGRQAVHLAERLSPDLILMDLSMPRMDGLEAIREIKKRWPQIKVLALTVHKTEEYVLSALQAGVDGYLLKDATHQEMMTAVRSVLGGSRYLSPGVSDKVIAGYLGGRGIGKTQSIWDTLTAREREILKLIGEGFKNKEIAAQLGISPKTVEKHRANLMEKLDLHNTSELTT
jgi:DNA-binding NarL/FixJ family response regulator